MSIGILNDSDLICTGEMYGREESSSTKEKKQPDMANDLTTPVPKSGIPEPQALQHDDAHSQREDIKAFIQNDTSEPHSNQMEADQHQHPQQSPTRRKRRAERR